MKIMNIVKGKALRDYFMQHVAVTKYPTIYRVIKPLHVFKKVLRHNYSESRYSGPYYRESQAIANLIIPVGARVHAGDGVFGNAARTERKLRADMARVHSIVTILAPNAQLSEARSLRRSDFLYTPGTTVLPYRAFFLGNEQCESGIHFYLNVRDAIDY